MKKHLSKKHIIIISIIAAIAVIALVAGFVVSDLSSNQVKNRISKEDAQKIVDEQFPAPASAVATGAKYVAKKSSITVNSIEYGYEKDIILLCTYKTLDVKSCLSAQLDQIMSNAYEISVSNPNSSATDISIKISKSIQEQLENATIIEDKITLHIYETANGMQLYLDKEMIDKCTGGMLSMIEEIDDIQEINYNGEIIDIKNNASLRRGVYNTLSLENYSARKPATGSKLNAAWVDFKEEFHSNFIEENRYMHLLKGLGNTLAITGLSALFGILLGFIIAIIRCTYQMTGKLKIIDAICRLYLTVMRGTPVMVQLLILFFVVLSPLDVNNFAAAVICFGLNSGAYVAEIVRGGIMSVDKGQIEAGRSLGFNYVQTMIHFIVPQAFKAILPSLANEFITLLKESSVAFYIGVSDLTKGGLTIRSRTFSTFMPLIAVALIYLTMVLILTKLVSIMERRLAKSDH